MTEKTQCAKQVSSGARWDFGGHQCSRNGQVFEEGQWWCKTHVPSTEQAKRDAHYEQYVQEGNARRDAQALLEGQAAAYVKIRAVMKSRKLDNLNNSNLQRYYSCLDIERIITETEGAND